MSWRRPLLALVVVWVWACGRSGFQGVDGGGPTPTPTGTSPVVTPTPPSYTLTITVSGGGLVTSNPSGIDCPSQCQSAFPAGSTVTLDPQPAVGNDFDGWDGACAGLPGTCQELLVSATSAVASFVPSG